MYFLFSIRGLKTDTTVHLLMKRARRQKMFKNKAAHRKRMAGMFSNNIHYISVLAFGYAVYWCLFLKYTDIMCKIRNGKWVYRGKDKNALDDSPFFCRSSWEVGCLSEKRTFCGDQHHPRPGSISLSYMEATYSTFTHSTNAVSEDVSVSTYLLKKLCLQQANEQYYVFQKDGFLLFMIDLVNFTLGLLVCTATCYL